jgi:hypothetical protein
MASSYHNTPRAREHYTKARREVLARLDKEIARLQDAIREPGDLATRAGLFEELHDIRYARLDLFDEDTGPRYRLREPCAMWNSH